MPKETFFNLPSEKRDRIVDRALDEFAARPFAQASLSRIVERSGIAKGSMYQYFEDKFDLYVYVLSLVSEAKMRAMAEHASGLGPDPDVFALLLAGTQAGINIGREDPRLLAVANNLMSESEDRFVDRVMTHLGAARLTREFFQQAIDRGQIDPRISPELCAFIISAITWQVGQDMVAGRIPVDNVTGFIKDIFSVLQHGMRPRGALNGEVGRSCGDDQFGHNDQG